MAGDIDLLETLTAALVEAHAPEGTMVRVATYARDAENTLVIRCQLVRAFEAAFTITETELLELESPEAAQALLAGKVAELVDDMADVLWPVREPDTDAECDPTPEPGRLVAASEQET